MADPTPLLATLSERRGSDKDVESLDPHRRRDVHILDEDGGTSLGAIQRSSLVDSCCNLCNIILGAGVFALPRVFAALGLLGGALAMVAVAYLTYVTVDVMLQASEKHGKWTYASSIRELWGHRTSKMVHISIIVGCAGFVTLYIIVTCDVLVGNKEFTGIIADLFPSLPDPLPWYLSRTALITWITISTAPLLSASTLHGMAFISAVSVASSTLSMLSLIILWAGAAAHGALAPPRWLPDPSFFGPRPALIAVHALAVLPIVMTAYICHMSIHPLAQDLSNYTAKRMRSVVAFSLTVCCACYAATGAAGFSTFGDNVAGDVLTNVQPESVARALGCSDATGLAFVGILKSLVAISMLTSVPINLWPVRADVLELLGDALGGQPGRAAFYTVTYGTLTAIYTTAVMVESAYSIVGLIGATCGIALAFLFPGLIALRLPLRQWQKNTNSSSNSSSSSNAVDTLSDVLGEERVSVGQRVFGAGLLVVGTVLMLCGVASTIIGEDT